MNRPAALRVGLFVMLATALLAAAVLWVSRDWFGATERVRLRFEGSVWGLQPGAPVVLRGVRVGQVLSIGLDTGGGGGAPAVPVLAELDRIALAPVVPGSAAGEALAPRLVQQGLVARLATQSLLTGLLYVDLDLDPALAAPRAATAAGLAEVPTRATALAALQRQAEQVDLAQIGADLKELAAAARRLVAQPEAEQALVRAARAAAALEALAAQLQRDWPPLARNATAVLEASRGALRDITPAATAAAREVAAAASATQGLARGLGQDGRAALLAVREAGEALTRAARQLSALSSPDGVLTQDAQRALADLSRAARSLRELAETLERHPDALLRGREEAPR